MMYVILTVSNLIFMICGFYFGCKVSGKPIDLIKLPVFKDEEAIVPKAEDASVESEDYA